MKEVPLWYASYPLNTLKIRYNVNGGLLEDPYGATDTSGNIKYKGSVLEDSYNYGTTGINLRDVSDLGIYKSNQIAIPGREWKCASGCISKFYSQSTNYTAASIANIGSSSKTVTMSVNWGDAINGNRCAADGYRRYISYCVTDEDDPKYGQCYYTQKDGAANTGWINRDDLRTSNNFCYDTTINGNRCAYSKSGDEFVPHTYYITRCTAYKCLYTKYDGKSQSGEITRNLLRTSCPTTEKPKYYEHTHNWNIRGKRELTLSFSITFNCSTPHQSNKGYVIYCSECGMSKLYYNEHIHSISGKYACSNSNHAYSNGQYADGQYWYVKDDTSIVKSVSDAKNVCGTFCGNKKFWE